MDEGRDPMERRTREEAAYCYAGFMRARAKMNSSTVDAYKNQMAVKSQSCSGGKPNCGRSKVSCSVNVVKEELISVSKIGGGSDRNDADETEVLLVDNCEFVAESFGANSRINVEKNGVNLGENLDSVAPESVVVGVSSSLGPLPHVYYLSSDSGNHEELSNNDIGEGSESEFERESPSWTMDHKDSESSDDSTSSDEDFWAKTIASKSYRPSICKKKETDQILVDEECDQNDSYYAEDFHPNYKLGTKQMRIKIREENETKKRSRAGIKVDGMKRRTRKLNFRVCSETKDIGKQRQSTKMADRLRSSQTKTKTKKRKYNECGTSTVNVITLSSDEQENSVSSDHDEENDIEKTNNQGKRIIKENEIIVLD